MGLSKEFLGVLIEFIGDIFVVAGYTGQRLATIGDPETELDIISTNNNTKTSSYCFQRIFQSLCSNPKWIAAFLIYALGQLLELVALGLATESTVVAIGNLTLVFNAIASVYVFGEEFSIFPKYSGIYIFYNWDAFNLSLLILGTAMTVAFAPLSSEQEEASYDASELRRMWTDSPFIYFNIIMIISMCILFYFCFQNFRNKNEKKAPMFLASSLAIMSAFSVTLSKVVTELISKTIKENNQFSDIGAIFMTVLWLILLVSQLVLLNIGLRNFEQGVFVPMFETMSASITIIFGIMYFKSYNDFHETGKIFGFWLGVTSLIIGLFLSSRRHSPTREEMLAKINLDSSPRFLRRFYSSNHSNISANIEPIPTSNIPLLNNNHNNRNSDLIV